MTDGNSLGLYIPEATTNLFTNPVFSASTYSDGWSGCVAFGNKLRTASTLDPRFILPETKTSVKISSPCALSGNTWTQQITAANTSTHYLSAYVKSEDSSAITSSKCALWYAASPSTTYQAVGDGWYRLSASRAGIAAACAAGIMVLSGQSVYVSGFQAEEKLYPTPLAYGDLLGCAWSSSPHNSTSTRTAAKVTLPVDDTILNPMRGSLRVIFTPDYYDRGDPASEEGLTSFIWIDGLRRDWLPAEPEPPKDELDWDLFLGPSPWRPYNRGYLSAGWYHF